MKKEGIPCIFYLYLHSKLFNIAHGETASRRDIKKYLSKWKIPKEIKVLVLKELELLGLIEREGRNIIKLNKSNFKIDDLRHFFKELKIY